MRNSHNAWTVLTLQLSVAILLMNNSDSIAEKEDVPLSPFRHSVCISGKKTNKQKIWKMCQLQCNDRELGF